MNNDYNDAKLILKADNDFNVTQASLIGNLPITSAYIHLDHLERFSINNRSFQGLRARGTAKRAVINGLNKAGYHTCNLQEIVAGLWERRNDTVGYSWEPLNERNKRSQDETIEFASRKGKAKKLLNGILSATSIFSLSVKELEKLPLPKDFKWHGKNKEYFIHHCRPDEEILEGWGLYSNSNSDDRPHLHWKTFLEYFESVNGVPQLAKAIYRSIPLDKWIEKSIEFSTIQLPNKPTKMTPLIASAVFGGDETLDKLQELLEMKHSKFLEYLLDQNIELPDEKEIWGKRSSYQFSVGIQEDGKINTFTSKQDDWDISDSCYNPCRQLFSNKEFKLPKIELPSLSTLLTERDQLYFRSLFGPSGSEAIFHVLNKYVSK